MFIRFILFFSFSFVAVGQQVFAPLANQMNLKPLRIDENIKADGHLDEAIWKQATAIHLDFQVEPFQGNKASFKTEVKVVYNHKYLYVAAIAHDTIGRNQYRSPNLKRDYMFEENDLFGIALDGFNDKRNAIVLQSNAYGVQRDLLSFDDRQYDVDWDGLYRVRTHRSDSSWVAEFAIPWQTLRYPTSQENEVQAWGINFFRVRRASNELSVWSPHPRSMSPLRMDYAGKMFGIVPPPPTKTNIRVNPYLLHDKSGLKMGGEVKWAISPTSILDFTVNTDFAQADVDRQVNNLSRFSVFFPERRQFFLENASLFGTGLAPVNEVIGGSMRIQPFFSRTIGLDASAQPLAITAGTRYVYRSEQRNFGGIFMRQGEGDGDPFTNFWVARYAENIGKQNRIGALVTTKQSPSYQQSTGAIDGFVRFNDQFSFAGMATVTKDSKTNLDGFAEYGQFLYKGNLITAYWTHSVVGENYNPAMGFVSRRNIMSNSQGIDFNVRAKWLPAFVRAWNPGVYTELYHSLSTGNLVEQRFLSGPLWFSLQNGGIIGAYVEASIQRLEDPFTPVGIMIKPGNFNYFRKGINLLSDPSSKYSGSFNYEWGGYYNGHLQYFQIKSRLSPIPHVNVGLSFERSLFEKVGTIPTNKQVDLAQIETRFALNPRVQLIGFYQKNTSDDLSALNLRFAWEYQPLSYIYLVFNQMESRRADGSRQNDQMILTKLSYLKQF